MSYDAWRRDVANGTMADWNEDRNGYDPPPEQRQRIAVGSTRLWDRQLKCWVVFHGGVPFNAFTGPNPRYSREQS